MRIFELHEYLKQNVEIFFGVHFNISSETVDDDSDTDYFNINLID